MDVHKRPEYIADDPLLNAQASAIETGRGLSTFWRDVRAGILPPPYYVAKKMPRWRQSELRSATDASPRTPAGPLRCKGRGRPRKVPPQPSQTDENPHTPNK